VQRHVGDDEIDRLVLDAVGNALVVADEVDDAQTAAVVARQRGAARELSFCRN
jgi:hypothetical protein